MPATKCLWSSQAESKLTAHFTDVDTHSAKSRSLEDFAVRQMFVSLQTLNSLSFAVMTSWMSAAPTRRLPCASSAQWPVSRERARLRQQAYSPHGQNSPASDRGCVHPLKFQVGSRWTIACAPFIEYPSYLTALFVVVFMALNNSDGSASYP